MRSKRRILLVAMVALVLGALIWLVLPPREPVYQGRPLTYWLEKNGYRLQNQTTEQFTASLASDPAIRQIGTNAIPTLLRLMRAYDSPLKMKLILLAYKQHFLKIHYVPASERHIHAMEGFLSLGADARFAVPDLVDILQHGRDDESKHAAAEVLWWIGPPAKPAVPALLHILNTAPPGAISRRAAVEAIRKIDPETAALRKNELEAALGNPQPSSAP